MRYFSSEYTLDHVAHEMVNIMYNTTFFLFTNGTKITLNPAKKFPPHNVYEISGIEYNVSPAAGLLLMPGTTATEVTKQLRCKVSEILLRYKLQENYKIKTAMDVMQSVIRFPNNDTSEQYDIFNDTRPIKEHNMDFTWLFCDDINDCIVSQTQSTQLLSLSLSTIFWDTKDWFNIKPLTMSIDFPEFSDIRGNDNMLDNGMLYYSYYGLSLEIARILKLNIMSHKSPYTNKLLILNTNRIDDRVFWLKWEDAKPIKGLEDHTKSYKAIRDGVFLEYPTYYEPNDELRCFFTDMPIYEDCYIFDIYEQYIYIDIENGKPVPEGYELDIKLHEELSKLVPADMWSKAYNIYPSSSTLFIEGNAELFKIRNKINDYFGTRTLYCMRYQGGNYEAITYRQAYHTHLNKRRSHRDRKTSAFDQAIHEPPIKKNHKRYRQLVKYDEPRHLLVSPAYYHANRDVDFEAYTGCKMLVFRTFAPITADAVIASLDISDKQIKMLKEINANGVKVISNYSEYSVGTNILMTPGEGCYATKIIETISGGRKMIILDTTGIM